MSKKARITSQGRFEIKRAGIMKPARCQHREMSCGHWCALFGEPNIEHIESDGTKVVSLSICQSEFIFRDNEFEDQR
jgi:hypothetical protein